MKRILAILLCMTMLLSVVIPVSAETATGIRVTALKQTSSTYDLGIAADNVRLAWELGSDARGVYQSAYRLTIRDSEETVYDTGWVESAEQTGIKARNLEPETVYYWTVNVKDQYGNESGFADEASFETAPDTVSGSWIGSANLIRKEFTLDQPLANIDRARSYIGSASPLEIHINGRKVGDLVLSPKRSVADAENYYHTYDILPYLQNGANAVGVMLSGAYAMGNSACGMLKIWYKDGATQVIATGTDWSMTQDSPITRYDWFKGEDADGRLMNGWDTVGYDASAWTAAANVGSPVYDGVYHVGDNAGMIYAAPTFSGDYTIEAGLEITNSIGSIMFGTGNPNPAMWQFDAVNNTLRVHRPSGWGSGDIDVVPCSGIKLNELINVKIEITGTTVHTYIEGELVNTSTIAAGLSTGRVGVRTAVNEDFNLDYLRVVQNGATIFEDNFDTLNRDVWGIPAIGDLAPGITGTTIIDEIEPVAIYPAVSNIDTTKPYAIDGHMVFPTNCGTFYTKQSFSGDYSIEASVKTDNYFGLVFGNGTTYPLMAQLTYINGGQVKMHQQNNWSGSGITALNYPMNVNTEFTVLRVDVVGNEVTLSVNGAEVMTVTVAEGSTSGPVGIRETINENCQLDYLRVYQNGETVFSDDFDAIDTAKWTIPAQNTSSGFDTTKPYCVDGTLYLPTYCGIYYSKQSFSGDYTIEMEARSDNVFAPMFGSGNPNPPMWQFSGGNLAAHMPGSWGDIRRSSISGLDMTRMTRIRLDIRGNDVTVTINDTIDGGTITLPDGATSGPLGFREWVDESAELNYIRVIQNDEVIFEDNFDYIDTSKWTFPAQTTKYVVDFGKNMSGYVRVSGKLDAGDTVTLAYSEMVDEVGNIFANTTFHFPTCTYTFTGGADSFEPHFFYTGFRYVEVTGIDNPEDLTFTGCFVSDDIEQTGQFESSNDRLNRVFDLYYQSQRSNMVGNYTDCPQREKDGWTGDASVTKEAASILFSDYTNAEAYMRLMELNILDSGEPHCILPRLTTATATNFDIPWASAYFVFPYYTYMQTGDKYYIEMLYDDLVKVFDYYKSIAGADGVPDRVLYGDWLGYDNQEGKINRSALGGTYAYESGMLLSKMAEIIGRDHTELDAYLSNMYNALQTRYNQGDYWSSDTQTGNSMALDFDLVPPEQKDQIVERLVKNVTDYGSLRTGVLGTLSLYNVLSEENQHKVLLDATITGNKCSFGYMLDNGATSLWEYWDRAGEGFNSQGANGINILACWDSQNHCMMGGGLTAWLFEGLGGIRSTEAAYHAITFRPGLESELTAVNSSVDTMIGQAVSNWTYENGELDWTITIPVNAEGRIVIPVADATVIKEGGVNVYQKDGNGLTYVGVEDGAYVYTAGSGTYEFHVTKEPVAEYAAEVDALIDAVGTVTVESGEAIEAARAAYDALDDSAKALVTKLAVLEAAEKQYKTLTTEVVLTLNGAEKINAYDKETVYTLSGKDMSDLATVILTFEISDEYLTDPEVKAAGDWYLIAQEYEDGKLTVVAANNGGANGEGDILTLALKPTNKPGDAVVSLTNAALSAYLGETETFVTADLSAATVSVKVDYSIYDVNHDGVVNQLDVTRSQRVYGTADPTCDVNKDGEVNIADLILILNNYTK